MKEEYGVNVEWRAFEIKPGLPPEGIVRPLAPGKEYELPSRIRHMSEEAGLVMKQTPFIANSRLALEAAEYAKEQGLFDSFHLGVFKAYWEDGRNIGLRDVLLDIAESCGLDTQELGRALDENRYTQRIIDQGREPPQHDIYGVPAYIIGKHVIVGAQPYDAFQRAFLMS